MPRKSFVPGAAVVIAAALAAGLTGCTGGSSSEGVGADAKGGDASTASQAAEPGRYQTLPEACGLPSRGILRRMLPGDGQHLSSTEAEKVYGGQADVTYDTDRRVGCRWTRETTEGTRHLSLDIQRVVSYDAAVSDDDKAQGIYDSKELAAKIPAAGSASPTTPSPSPSTAKGKGAGAGGTTNKADTTDTTDKASKDNKGDKGDNATKDGKAGEAGKDASGTPSGASDPSADPSASTAPRVLDGLGDAAFLDDELVTADSGLHRDVTVVFRTSNVIVTITYDQWSTDKTMLPDSQELQDKARSLAGELADSLSE
ncbi:hypothetical protein AB0C96_07020 [Streptomyces sp. NPDC048506]|uniref:hypothetical protein n=1 Tax=Streptomyces sp. NPDC048506 TaxID=3155028 RepID=UPI003433C312